MPVVIFAAAVVIYAAVAAQDLRQRQISNLFCIGIAVLGVARWAMMMQTAPAAWALGAAVILFVLGIVFAALNWMGGGDVKLIAATGLLVGGGDTLPFLFLMSILGGAIALLMLIYFGLRRLISSSGAAPSATVPSVPYGVAIAIAASVDLFLQFQRA